jgi:large subunit ribosomal protein L17
MKKKVFGRQFKRDTNERKALFKGLMTELVMRESIQTTLPKAKSIKGQVEKLVTKAKVRGTSARPFIQPFVSIEAVEKIITKLAVRFADRPGGYTRIVKIGSRFSDNADMAVIEWVERADTEDAEKIQKTQKKDSVPAVIANSATQSPKPTKQIKKATVKTKKAKKETK